MSHSLLRFVMGPTLLAGALSLAGAKAQARTEYACESARDCSVPFDFIDQRIFATVRINGDLRPLKMIFDSGGSNILSLEAAQRLGLPLQPTDPITGAGSSAVPAWTTHVTHVSLGRLSGRDQEFLVLDLNSIQRAFHFEHFDGVLGYEILKDVPTRIDYQSQVLTFGNETETGTGVAIVPLQIKDGHAVVNAVVNGVEGKWVVDTGDRSAVSLCTGFAQGSGLAGLFAGKPEIDSGFGVGGLIPARLGLFETFSFGGFPFSRVLGRLPDLKDGFFAKSPLAGTIGNEVLKRFTVSFDYRNSRMSLRKNGLFDVPVCFTSLPDSTGATTKTCAE